MPPAPFGFGGILGGGPVPDVQMPDGLPVSGGKGSPLVDAFLALQGQRIKDAVTAPRDAFTGDLQVMGPDGHPTAEAMNRANGLAGLAMTGSMPLKAPKGALRMFGGAEAHEDPLAALSAALDQNMGSVASDVRPISRVDTSAKSWDLYHGTSAPEDFARFDPNRPQETRTHSPGSEAGAVFLSPAADEAAHYAGDVIGKDTISGAGPRVIRATVDPGKTAVLDIPHLLENDPSFVARARENFIQNDAKGRTPTEAEASRLGAMFDDRHARMLGEFRSARDLNDQLAALGYPASEVPQAQWGFGATGAAIQRAKEQGLDTAVLRGLSESNGGDQIVALTPGVEASPLGQISQRPDVAAATRALFGQNPGPGTHREVAGAMQALVRNDAPAAESLARTYLESVFNEATQQTKGVASQYGGAGFASAIRGNAQQRHNLEAVVRALPNGETRWNGLDRLLTTLEATGFRPAKGSDTAFNHAIQKEFQSGKTHVGQAVSDALTGMAAGAAAGGVKGGVAGFAVGAKHGVSEAMMRARMLNSGEAVARLMFDPKAMPDLRALSKSPPGSKNAELFTTRLLSLANAGLAPAREPAPQ
jgi:hypothetical protein